MISPAPGGDTFTVRRPCLAPSAVPDAPSGLHDQPDAGVGAGQHADVGEWVPIDGNQVGERTGAYRAKFPVPLEDGGCDGGGRANRLKVAEQFRADAEFLRGLVLVHFPEQVRAEAHLPAGFGIDVTFRSHVRPGARFRSW